MRKMAGNFKVKVPKFMKSVKYTLAGVNVVSLLMGLILLTVGIRVLVVNLEYEELITKRFINVPRFVIATGVIILLICILGVYAALSEHFLVVAGYAVLLLLVLIFELAFVIAAFQLRNVTVAEISPTMRASLQQYSSRLEVAKLWDDMQMEFECCGVVGRFDYASYQIPVSCCRMDYGTISPFECTTANSNPDGCAQVLGDWLSYNLHVIAITALIATCVQVLLVAMGAWLAWRSKFEVVELES